MLNFSLELPQNGTPGPFLPLKVQMFYISIDREHIFCYILEKEQMFLKGTEGSLDMKGYRITSRVRFIAFVAISIIIFTMAFNMMFELNTAQSETKDNYIKVGVMSGDSLWSIAQTYMPDTDTREAVYIIKKVNGLESDCLSIGSTLDIPA